MVDIPFLKKLEISKFSLGLFSPKSGKVVGIDIGMFSTKVVQLRYESERAVLESYGELLNERYFKGVTGVGGGFLRYEDSDLVSLIKDVMTESNITSRDVIFSIPAASCFVAKITLPKITPKEVESAVPFEARKYIPIPISEVILDWDIMPGPEGQGQPQTDVLLVALPRQVVEKYKRVGTAAGLNVKALEVETFSLVRSLVGHDQTPQAIVNFGYRTTTLAIVDQGKMRVSHNFDRGSLELTKALERGLNVNFERAEQIKRDIGLGERVEEKEISSIMLPILSALLSQIDRTIDIYNRKAPRKIQKIILTGGGSQLKGLVELTASTFGIEVARGNPFGRIVSPPFMQPILREIGPYFAVSAGLALREISTR
ncbi:MAG: type IV pilus assembly protein PilM [bacterium]|nr:type IV pilus assembly protein PilM [bacterium]MDZ4286019.1 type IV pilus assembly protein PilM [Candidatus Sungbacteria bacterium]